MDNCDDEKRDQSIEEALRQLCDQVHLPPEVILAYAEGRLTSEGWEAVARHINGCEHCQCVLRLTKECSISGDVSNVPSEAGEVVVMPGAVDSKARLLSHISSKKDAIVQEMSKLLLHEDSWFAIVPTVKALRNWRKHPPSEHGQGFTELRAAAFAASGSAENKRLFEIVARVTDFVDLVCMQLSEHCHCTGDLETELSTCIDDAESSGDCGFLNAVSRAEIHGVIRRILAGDVAQ